MSDSQTAEFAGEGFPLDLLIVEDNPADVDLYLHELRRAGYNPRCDTVQTCDDFCAKVTTRNYHVVLCDFRLPGWTGREVSELLLQMDKNIPVILVTGVLKEESAAECFRMGIFDYVLKDSLARLPMAVSRALREELRQQELLRLDARCREFEKRYQRLAESSPDALFIQSGDRLVYCNAAALCLLGAENIQLLLGQSLWSLVAPESAADLKEQLNRLRLHQESAALELRLIRLDGKRVVVKMIATSLLYQGKPANQLIFRDVTERKRVEEAITTLAAFAQLNPNPVMEFSHDGRLTYFNEATNEMIQSLGEGHPSAILPPETTAIVQGCLATGQKKLRLETVLAGRTISWSFFPIKPNKVVHAYARDITEQLNLEAQLRHSQRLESVGRLAAGVAHDINNILVVIQGNSDLLRVSKKVSPDLIEPLEQISQAADRAGKLTTKLLAFSRRNIIQPKALDLNEVIRNVMMLLHRTLGEDVILDFTPTADLPPIFADESMMEQVIINLAVNARDAMAQGGHLTIQTAVVPINDAYAQTHPEARVGDFDVLTIADTGCGMDNVTLSRIFEPFFTTKEAGKGTGLGLATVYGIVKQHQGWIEVNSQKGKGTSFRVYLPRSLQDACILDPTRSAPPPRGGNETILVVEDDPAVRATVQTLLQHEGYRVFAAASGSEAQSFWKEHGRKIDLLITDMVVSREWNGPALAELFKTQKPELKVIYTSGYGSPPLAAERNHPAELEFLQKPYDAAKLARAVRRSLDGARDGSQLNGGNGADSRARQSVT